ncbi:MAG: flagellin [Hungatella sp.]|nr:flagellin [Hungatella sp.]
MVIQHNIAAINSYRNLGVNQSSLNKNLEKLSSGYRVNRAGDDAAGLAISESMRSQINGLNQATKNAQDAVGLIQTAEGALTEVHSMLQRLTTLASQSANGTYNSVARMNLQSEVNELMAEIDRIANYTDFNGIKPLAMMGTNAGPMTFQIGPSAGETLTLQSSDMTAKAIFSAFTANMAQNPSVNGNANAMTLIITGGSSVSAGGTDVSGANRAISAINAAINNVSSYRAKLGAAQNRLEHTINNLKVTSENITAAESRIRDTDMADEITAFTKNNILLQASQSMLAQSNSVPQSVLSLLG